MRRTHGVGRLWVLTFVLGACQPLAENTEPAPAGPDGGHCVDVDNDGFGDGCSKGRDCDDTNADMTNECLGCLSPDQGCPCSDTSPQQACFLEADSLADGRLMCHEGTRTCRSGVWSGCESVHSYALSAQASTRLVSPDAAHPNCTPCDVLCRRVDDYLDVVDGGLTDANSDEVDWLPGGGITIASYEIVDGGVGFDAAVDNDAAVPVCQLGVPPDIDCDGLPDDVDPYPDTPPFATNNDIIYFRLAPGQTGSTGLELTFNLNNADIYFLVDQSGSMDGERDRLISDLRSGTFLAPSYNCADTDFDGMPNNELKSQGIVGSVRCMIRDAWFGSGYFVEYPLASHGDAYADGRSDDEVVFRQLSPISQDLDIVDTALSTMYVNTNIDWPESDVPALWSLATGQGMYLGHNRMGVPPQTSCPAGRHAYPCFRNTAIPIVVLFTDASFHNGPTPTPNAYSASYNIALGTETTITPVPSTNDLFTTAYDVGDVTNRLVTFAGTSAAANADVPGSIMGCGASSTMRDVMFKFDVTAPRSIVIKTDGTVQDTLITLFGGIPTTAPSTTTPVSGESNVIGDVYGQWRAYTGNTTSNVPDYQGGVVGCNAGGSGNDSLFQFTASQSTTVSLTSGLPSRLAWWRMGDGDSYPTVTDVTGAHNGTMVNMAANDLVADAPPAASGFSNAQSVDFDGGNDVINIVNDPALSLTSALTVSAWVKGASQTKTIVSKYENTGDRRSWRISSIGDKARINISATGGPYNSANVKQWDTSRVILDGTWHHIAITFAGGTLKVYVDGAEDTAVVKTYDPVVPTLYATSAPVVIGGHYNVQNPFGGRIDEVAIWKTALSSAEIALLYSAGNTVDLNQTGGAQIALYSALPPTAPVATALPNTNTTVATAHDAAADLVDRYLSFSGSTAAAGMYPVLSATTAGCGATANSNDALFKFRLAQDRRVRVDTEGSSFDTVLSLHNVPPGGTEARTSTNANDAYTAPEALGPLGGKSYLISGNAVALQPDYDAEFVGCGAAAGANDAVYSFTLAGSTSVRIDPAGSSFSPVVSLHTAIPTPTSSVSANTNEALATGDSLGAINGIRRIQTGNTAAMVSDYAGSVVGCGAVDSARDAVSSFTLTSPAAVVIDSQGSTFDTVLGLFNNLQPSDTLVGWWRMGDGDTYPTLASVVGGYSATMTNMASNDLESVAPTPQDHPNTISTNFDGVDDHALVADAAALRITSALTVSAWVKGPSQGATGRTIVSKYQTTGDQRAWRMWGVNGDLEVGISRDGTWTSATAKDYRTSGVTVFDNNWHHVAFTFENDVLRLYVDGVLATVTQVWNGSVPTIYSSTSSVVIGAYLNGAATTFFTGNIDEVSVWNSAFTATQVGQLYNGRAPSNLQLFGQFPATKPPATVAGAPSIGVDLDGSNDYIDVATDATLNITNNLTVSLWANVTNADRTLASKYRTSGNNRSWRMYCSGGKFAVSVSANGSGSSSTMKDYETNASVCGVGWVHLAFTFSSNVLTLYVNGAVAAVNQLQNPTVNTIYSTTTPKTILGGYENNGSGAVTDQPQGVLDEFSIWNAALTGAQITALYNAGTPTDLTAMANLALWWRLGDGDVYPTVVDRVAGRNGTMRNMASDDFVPGVAGAVFYSNERKSSAYDAGAVNGRWRVYSGNTTTLVTDGPTFGCNSNASARDAYFTFTLTSSASLDIDTIGSGFDTALGLFRSTATSFDSTELVACDDNGGGGVSSRILTGTLAAGTYYVVIKGATAAAAGAYMLSIKDVNGASMVTAQLGQRLACNDDDGTETTSRITTAVLPAGTYHVILKSTGGSGAYTLRVSQLGAGSGRIACSAGAISQTLGAGTYTVVMKGTTATSEGAYTLRIEDAGTVTAPLACNDDAVGTGSSAIERDLLANTDYYVTVKGKSAAAKGAYMLTLRDVTGVPSNRLSCGNHVQTANVVAGQTYYAVVKGDAVAGDGPFSLLVQDTQNAGSQFIACDDNGGPGSQSNLTRMLNPGTYYLAMKKANHVSGQGNYQITFGGAASSAGTYAPPTWAQTISALNAADIRVMTVYSTGGSDTATLVDHATALANATGAIGPTGNPLVSSMAGDGSGLSSALVTQIQELAQYLSMDVGLRVEYTPDTPPPPGFLFNFVAVDESPGNGCNGVVGIEHQDCLPGAVPRFIVNITNPVGTPVPPNPSDPFGGYNFRIQLIGNGRYVVDEVPVYIVPLMALPPAPPLFQASGSYWQDVDSRACTGNQRPSWRDLLFDATLPAATRMTFEICTGSSQSELDMCMMRNVVTIAAGGTCTATSDCASGATCAANGVCRLITANACTVPTDCASMATCISNVCTYAGSPTSLRQAIGTDGDFRALLRLKTTLFANPTRTEAPRLDEWRIHYECNAAE